MKIQDYMVCAWNNLKGRGKTGRLLLILLFFALFIYFVINSMANSVFSALEKMQNVPSSRMLIIDDDKQKSIYNEMKKRMSDDSRIADVYQYVAPCNVKIDGILEGKSVDMVVQSYPGTLEAYICFGKAPEKGEMLLPEYMYGMGTGEYLKGSDLIGQTVSFFVEDYNSDRTYYEYTISGTYNNIYAVAENNRTYIPDDEAVNIVETRYIGWEKKLQEAKERDGNDDRIVYSGYYMTYRTAIAFKYYSDMEKIKSEFPDIMVSSELHTSESGLEEIFSFARFLGNIVVILLLAVVLISIVITVMHDISRRRAEMAVFMTQGYLRKQVVNIITLEYAIRLIQSFAAAFVLAFFIIQIEQYSIVHFLSMEYQVIQITFSLNLLIGGTIIMGIILLAVMYQANQKIKDILLSETLKMEG